MELSCPHCGVLLGFVEERCPSCFETLASTRMDGELLLGGGADPTTGNPPFVMRRLDMTSWRAYLAAYDFGRLPPSKVVLHHTWKPTLADWKGQRSMTAMQNYYAGKGWWAGPHIYAAPDGIWLATPMYDIGIHAGAGNGSIRAGWYSIGLEMVGNYDLGQPGGNVWMCALEVMAGLSRRLRIVPARLISFHRDYTNAKTCPGTQVSRPWVLGEVTHYLTRLGG